MRNGPIPAFATLLTFVGLAGCGPTATPSSTSVGGNPAANTSAATILPDDLYNHIAQLSSDDMEGRDTPSEGLEAAAAYLVAQHEGLGLEPAGENGTFYQRYPFGGSGGEESFPANVIAVLPGSDPELRDEYVVLSAHYDHVGIGRPVNGDSIYNGADDNGSGTAALLEVAEAFTRMPEAPARSIIFLHVSGEEHGLLGSEWFSDHPTIPLEQIVANVNVDMIGRNSPDSIVVIGKQYTTLGEVVHDVADAHEDLGLIVADDPWPQERFFFRSDHFNFARKRIPAIFFFAGVHEDYHQPSDTVEKIDTDKATRVSRLIFHTVHAIAEAKQRPAWDPDGWAEVQGLTR